jgi:hypothetical protein
VTFVGLSVVCHGVCIEISDQTHQHCTIAAQFGPIAGQDIFCIVKNPFDDPAGTCQHTSRA